jgi:hypothetical protein
MVETGRHERRLLLLCARPRLSARDEIDLVALLRGDLDWTAVVSLALHHGIAQAVSSAFTRPGVRPSVPPDILSALSQYGDSTRARNEILADELMAILAMLAERGVMALPFKGPVLATLLYGDLTARAPGDLDLLVRLHDVTTTCDVLVSRGYRDLAAGRALTDVQHRLYRQYQCEYQFIRDRDSIVVEPHWAAAARTRGIDLDYDAQFDRAQTVTFRGMPIRVHAPEDLLLFLCIHGGKHRWARLSWIRDVAALIARSEALGLHVEAAVERARRAGCLRFILLGLEVARQVLGVALPAGLDPRIAADRRLSGLVASVVGRLLEPARADAHEFRVDPFTLRAHDRVVGRVRHVTRTLLMPRREHLALVALPGRLAWLYYPLRWAHDYVAWPLWMLTRPFRRSRPSAAPEP